MVGLHVIQKNWLISDGKHAKLSFVAALLHWRTIELKVVFLLQQVTCRKFEFLERIINAQRNGLSRLMNSFHRFNGKSLHCG